MEQQISLTVWQKINKPEGLFGFRNGFRNG